MNLKTQKKTTKTLEINHYKGSLDYPCDFCETNSYDNYHFEKNFKKEFTVCKGCLEKAMSDKQ